MKDKLYKWTPEGMERVRTRKAVFDQRKPWHVEDLAGVRLSHDFVTVWIMFSCGGFPRPRPDAMAVQVEFRGAYYLDYAVNGRINLRTRNGSGPDFDFLLVND